MTTPATGNPVTKPAEEVDLPKASNTPPAPDVPKPAETVKAAAPITPESAKEPVIPPLAPAEEDPLEMLKRKADTLGIGYSKDATTDILRAKIQNHMNPAPVAEPVAVETKTAAQIKAELHRSVYLEGMKMLKLRITNLNPTKADLPGEIFTVSNKFLGTVRKYIPYGERTDNGWFVPACIYEQLKDRTFYQVKIRKGPHGQALPEGRWVKEFAIEVMANPDAKELKQMALRQAAAEGKSED